MCLAALDLSNLHNFAGGDGVFVIGICAAGFIIKFWRDGSIGKIVIILVVYALVAALLKGQALLQWLSGLLNLFGINTGF